MFQHEESGDSGKLFLVVKDNSLDRLCWQNVEQDQDQNQFANRKSICV